MNATLQTLATFAIVAVASGYALVTLMPKAWRARLAARAADLGLRFGLSAGAARRVEAKLASGGACGSCDSCKACATPKADAAQPPPPSFRSIPIRRA